MGRGRKYVREGIKREGRGRIERAKK